MRIEPPPSVPSASGPSPAASAAAAPALEPPGVCARLQGLRVTPVSGLSPNAFQPNSGSVVLPSSTAPCSRSRATGGASSAQSWSRRTRVEPRSVGQPLVRKRSLIVTGTPSSSPSGAPFAQRASAARASASALSRATSTKALISGSSRSRRRSSASVTSTGDSVLRR